MTTTINRPLREADNATMLAHGHGLHDIAGYLLVETDWSTGEIRERDVAHYGPADYGRSLEDAHRRRLRSGTQDWVKVVTVYTDGCRGQ